MKLSDSLEVVKGVGPALSKNFESVGIHTVEDLIRYYPRKYTDYSHILKIHDLKPGSVTIEAVIKQVKGRFVRGGLHITEAAASDSTGSVRLTWFNQPYRAHAIKPDMIYYISGNLEFKNGRLAILNPNMEIAGNFPVNTARIVPIYHETKRITSLQIRKILREVFKSLPTIKETIPDTIRSQEKLLDLYDAIKEKHFPSSMKSLQKADQRLGFEELFDLILASMFSKQSIEHEKSLSIAFNEQIAKNFVKHLSFTLTNAQRKSVWQIYQDMQTDKPMNRLLEGDVGAGKTVVATMAGVMVINAGYQVAIMAPTELLARQHADNIYSILEPLRLEHTVALLVGSMKLSEKKRVHSHIQNGTSKFLIGTHALLQEKVDMQKLGLVIVDEQHRFGVNQRKVLIKKAGHTPHMLSMTATPIPRSLALTVFGELDVSILDTKPKNRKPIITKLVTSTDRLRVYKKIDEHLDAGRQMFVVCPLVADSEAISAKSAETVYKELKNGYFSKRKLGLLHGKMKPEEKQQIMQDFIDQNIDVLVSTTVIEVGVDVPNATIMMIEAPDRFGLAQLHQLRGRVGRGEAQAHCYLMLSDSNPPSRRLKAIESCQDGFKLAELDLELRGAGALYGTMQHGQLDLRIANFTDKKLIHQAREAAKRFIANPHNLIQYPHIKKRITELQHVVHLN